jgi:hypothetical protein
MPARCWIVHRTLLGYAPERLYEEISADYNRMIYAAKLRRPRCGASHSLQLAAQGTTVTVASHSSTRIAK